MRRFPLILTRRSSPAPLFDRLADSYILSGTSETPATAPPPERFTHQLSRASKGKAITAPSAAPSVGDSDSDPENVVVSVARAFTISASDAPPPAPLERVYEPVINKGAVARPPSGGGDRNHLQVPVSKMHLDSRTKVPSISLSAINRTSDTVDTEFFVLDAPLDHVKNPALVLDAPLDHVKNSALASLNADITQSPSIDASGSALETDIQFRDSVHVIPASDKIETGFLHCSSNPIGSDNTLLLSSKSIGKPILTEPIMVQVKPNKITAILKNPNSFSNPSSEGSKQNVEALDDLYRDASKQPPANFVPPGFKWHFLLGTWTLIPKENSDLFDSCIVDPDSLFIEEEGEDFSAEAHNDSFTGLPPVEPLNPVSPDHSGSFSEDSSYDFPDRVQRLLQSNSPHISPVKEAPQANRRSTRPKKPPARWAETDGSAAVPPQSGRKKGTADRPLEEGPTEKRRRLESPSSAVRRSIQFSDSSVGDDHAPSSDTIPFDG